MLSKNQIKIINSLKQKKFRQKYDLFVAEGTKIVQTLLQSDKYKIQNIYHTHPLPEVISQKREITQVLIGKRMMKSISLLNTPSSLLALVKPLKNAMPSFNKAIYLDGVQDPGNAGTIIRIADWFGIDTVMRSEDSADFYNPKVVQSTMGALANVNLAEMPRIELLNIKDTVILAADMHGINIDDMTIPSSFILILGSEGQGVSDVFNTNKVTKISISGDAQKISESLNVSVAAGIICAKMTTKH